jgi:hypothetical protein
VECASQRPPDFRFHVPHLRVACIRPSSSTDIDIEFTYSNRSPFHLTQFFLHSFLKPSHLDLGIDLVIGTFSMPFKMPQKALLGLLMMGSSALAQQMEAPQV